MEAPDRPDQPLFVALDWITRHCVIPDGFDRGRAFELYDFQLRYLAGFYLVRGSATWNPARPVAGPAFRHRRGLLIEAQKKGKSPLIAAQVCLEGVGPALFAGWAERGDTYSCEEHGCPCGWVHPYEPGDPMGRPWPTPLIQITAASKEQTDNTYDALRPMIERGRLADVIPATGEEFIRLPNDGRIDVVTSSAKSRLGQRVTFVPQDEVGTWVSKQMRLIADTQYRGLAGMGGRASLTTNAYDPSENSVGQQQFESSATDILRQFDEPPKHLSWRNKRERRKILRLAYAETLRERGGHVDLDSIEAEAADLSERDPGQAERFFGNRRVAALGTWMPEGLWESAARDGVVVPDGAPVSLGFDGSESSDWTAIRLVTRDGHRFTPRYGPDSRPTVWNPDEWGGSIPRGEVSAAVDELCSRFRVRRAFCDPRDWQSEIGDWALKHGDDVFVEWQTYRIVQMHAALERALTDLVTGRSTHDGCRWAAMCVANARKAARPGERYILVKPSEHQKIDVAMADVLAYEAWADLTAGDGWQPTAEEYAYVM